MSYFLLKKFNMDHEGIVSVYSNGTYEYSDFTGRDLAPARFRFSPSGKLRIVFYRLNNGNRAFKNKLTINPEASDERAKEFYSKLKSVWDEFLIENLLLGDDSES